MHLVKKKFFSKIPSFGLAKAKAEPVKTLRKNEERNLNDASIDLSTMCIQVNSSKIINLGQFWIT